MTDLLLAYGVTFGAIKEVTVVTRKLVNSTQFDLDTSSVSLTPGFRPT